MDVYLAGISYEGIKEHLLSGELNPGEVYALESFYSIQNWQIPYIHKFGKFMLDSGAFTFIYSGRKTNIDWEKYADAYADFVRENDIRLFFELDIDVIVGIAEVERLRYRIEKRASRQCIPVWHTSRGKDYFLSMCKDYDYVAIGGLASKGGAGYMDKFFPWFINTAHANETKIHGLGYTKTKNLAIYNFDSVDSTTWTSAGRFGQLHRFTGKDIERIDSIEGGVRKRRLRSYKEAMWYNFKEWMKFQKYMARR